MRKTLTSLVVSGLVLLAAPVSVVSAKQIPPKKYSTCAALRRDFPNGVAIDWFAKGQTKAVVNADVYNLNFKKLDKKVTGLLCARKAK